MKETIRPSNIKRPISLSARKRIEAQGFLGYSDCYLAEVNHWLRLAPFVCMTWVAIGTYLSSPFAIWALMPFALMGAVLPGHPFDVIYNHGIRHWIGTPALPTYGKPRRFACGFMTLWLAVTGYEFYSGWPFAGFALGTIAAVLAMVNVTSGFCVPSFVYGLVFGKPQSPAKSGTSHAFTVFP
jgi:hypothetical protein